MRTGARRGGRTESVRSSDKVDVCGSVPGVGCTSRDAGLLRPEDGEDVLYWTVMGVAIALVGVFTLLVISVPTS
jgi:hypothetical protein